MKVDKMAQIGINNQNLINSNFIGKNYLSNIGQDGSLNLSDNQDFQNLNF